jgi:hypothetical protein
MSFLGRLWCGLRNKHDWQPDRDSEDGHVYAYTCTRCGARFKGHAGRWGSSGAGAYGGDGGSGMGYGDGGGSGMGYGDGGGGGGDTG